MEGAKIIELNDSNTCRLCNNALGKYSCPRCNIRFCSITCYKSHDHLECSEIFYQECVMSEIKLNGNDKKEQEKIMEILRRTQADFDQDQLDSDDDDEPLDLSERLAGIDLNDAASVWDKLTSDEKQDFESFLRSEDVSKIVPPWNPWWSYRDERKVCEVNEEKPYMKNCPLIRKNIKDFSALTKKQPAECVKYNLVNVIASYAFTTRYFNGDHFDFPAEAASCISSISLYLKNNQNLIDHETAISSIQHEILNIEWIFTDQENLITMKEDCGKILKGPEVSNDKFYIMCALSDLYKLFTVAKKAKRTDINDSFSKVFSESKFPDVKLIPKEQLKLHMKKIDYLLSYSKDYFEN